MCLTVHLALLCVAALVARSAGVPQVCFNWCLVNGQRVCCNQVQSVVPTAVSTSPSCQFPFIHAGVIYTTCTTKDDPNGKRWCSTQTDNRNNHITGKWMHCQDIASSPPTSTSSLLPSQCGDVGDSDRIVGGTELPMQSFTWMALLGFGQRNNPAWLCGGSLITQRYVVTAAHCVTEQPVVKVRLGEYDTSKARDCQQLNNRLCAPPVQDFLPEQIISHPSWTQRSRFSDDIALIRLNGQVKLNSYVQPICLPKNGLNVEAFLRGREAEVAGWGATENGKLADVKRVVKVPFQRKERCHDGNNVPIRGNGQLCFGAADGRDSCGGDSGGPLVSTDTSAGAAYVLLGVVSYGPNPCGHNEPAVYTDVGHYRNWIESNLRR